MGELERLVASCRGQFRVNVLFLEPEGETEEWVKTDLWDQAAAIPGVRVLSDKRGVEAQRFHAATSGQTLLYDAHGRLLFNGGITVARGHAGDNSGSAAVEALLSRRLSSLVTIPVFGCALDEGECQQGGAACKL